MTLPYGPAVQRIDISGLRYANQAMWRVSCEFPKYPYHVLMQGC